MKPRLSIITLGVHDLKRSLEFYLSLGFELETEENTDNIAFFLLNNKSLRLALFPHDRLAEDAEKEATGSGFKGFTLAHNVNSEAEVDATLKEAVSKGAELVKKGQKVFWGGYSGYFSDPDGFLWKLNKPLSKLHYEN